MSLLLKIVHCNWGLIGPGEWEEVEWSIYSEATFSIKESFRPDADDLEIPDVITKGRMGHEDFDRIRQAVESEWNSETVDACDGDAWEFWKYNLDGTIEKHRPLGYINNMEPFDEMTIVLENYFREG